VNLNDRNNTDLNDLHELEDWLRATELQGGVPRPSAEAMKRVHAAAASALAGRSGAHEARWRVGPAWGGFAAAAMIALSAGVVWFGSNHWVAPQRAIDPLNRLAAVVEPVESVDAPYVELLSAFEDEYAMSGGSGAGANSSTAVESGSGESQTSSLDDLMQDVEQFEWELAAGWEI